MHARMRRTDAIRHHHQHAEVLNHRLSGFGGNGLYRPLYMLIRPNIGYMRLGLIAPLLRARRSNCDKGDQSLEDH